MFSCKSVFVIKIKQAEYKACCIRALNYLTNIVCYCSATEQCVFSRMHWAFTKMACYGDVPFKQRAVSELIVARKGLATNIHKPLKMYMVSLLLIKTLLVLRLHELQVLKKAKRN